MKKWLCFVMTMILGTMLLTACGNSSQQPSRTTVQNQETVNNITQAAETENLSVVEKTETVVQQETTDEIDIQTETEVEDDEQTETVDAVDVQTGRVLVVYYSATGNTKAVGDVIAQYTDADTFEIIPVVEYTDEDLDWTQKNSRVNLEHEDESLQDIALVSTIVDNFDSYDTVFIGYPIWWREAAWVVNHFVKDNDFTGKTVIPFCTSSSSDLGESGMHLAEMAGTGNWQEGIRFSGDAEESEVTEWLDGLDF